MRNLVTISVTLSLFFLTSCFSPKTGSTPLINPAEDEMLAQQILVDFFRLLHEGDYLSASGLYAGSYQWLMNNNPYISATDLAGLLEYGCRYNGLMCLEVRSVRLDPESSPAELVFLVEFNLEDDSLFVLGPCCGATETEQPPVSLFQYQVVKQPDGSFAVTDLPVYVP